MGGDPDRESRMETVARRVEFLELLDEEGPLPPRDVVDALEYSRGTVTRALRELREADLVEKREEGYAPTLVGVMAAEEYRRYEIASHAILGADDLLAAIPRGHAPPVEVLVDADAILADAEVPVRALEAVSDRVREADTVRAYLPTLVNTHLLRVWHRAVVGGGEDDEAIFDPHLLTVLKGQYPHLLAEMAATEGFTAYETTGPPYGLILTSAGDATTVELVVYEDDTAVRGVLTNDAPAAVEWARGELDRLANGASDVTADLDALSAAVADGLARPPSTGSGGSRSAGAAGHALPIDLEAEGFVRLSGEYFDAHGEADPAVSWRTGFTLAEVRAGHALDRRDAEGRLLTEYLVEALETGADHVVLGPPGSGKSTACMAVACEWYERGVGPVVYRERGEGDRFESAALLEAYLRRADDHALVVVEDAIRDEANAAFAVMRALDADDSVTFLFDARTHEWRDPEAFELDARLDAYRRTALEEVTVPALDEHECERFVAHFSDLVGTDLDLSGDELFTMVEEGTAGAGGEGLPAGEALVAQHYLARRYDPPVDTEASGATALDEAARQTYRTLTDAEASLAPDLAVLVALLTAAGVPVADEYCYAVADPDEYGGVETALSLLEGRLLFDDDAPRAGGSTAYRTRHETWAMRFLEGILDLESTASARERFGRCVTRLLALADEGGRRERIQRHLGGRTPYLHQIEADPRGWADELVERIFGVGRTDASLAPLFGETTGDAIALPEACSAWTHLRVAYWRGEINRTHGDLARAEREFRTLGKLAEEMEFPAETAGAPAIPGFTTGHADSADDLAVHRTRWRATSRTNLGLVARDRGDFETAAEYYREAIALFREVDDREGKAISLKNLGAAAYLQSDYDRAREYFEQSLTIARALDARAVEARCLNNLGIVAQDRDKYDRAREYHERSLKLKRGLGDRQGEANSLSNLGLIAQRQGAYDRAREYHERSLDIRRELGDSKRTAISLNNIGMIARDQGDYDRAREYFERSFQIRRTIGNRRGEAHSLNEMGELARLQGEYETARNYLAEATDTFEAVESESGIARALLMTGRLALARDELDPAREHAREARETFEELGSPHWEGRSHHLLGRIAAAEDAPEEACEHWRAALETFETVGASQDALETLAALVETCREQGDEKRAGEWCRRAKEIVADAPDPTAAWHREWIERHAAELEGK